MRISDWSSACALPICLHDPVTGRKLSPISAATARSIALRAWTGPRTTIEGARLVHEPVGTEFRGPFPAWQVAYADEASTRLYIDASSGTLGAARSDTWRLFDFRSEAHTSELQSLMRHSYAVLCLKKK